MQRHLAFHAHQTLSNETLQEQDQSRRWAQETTEHRMCLFLTHMKPLE